MTRQERNSKVLQEYLFPFKARGICPFILDDNTFNFLRQEGSAIEQNLELVDTGLSAALTNNMGVSRHYAPSQEMFQVMKDLTVSYIPEYDNWSDHIRNCKILSDDCGFTIIKDGIWWNKMNPGDFIPNHIHDGVASWTTWVKIPHKEQQKCYGNIEFTTPLGPSFTGKHSTSCIVNLTEDWEGILLMFPAGSAHCVYPFYEGYRVSMSGNIYFDVN